METPKFPAKIDFNFHWKRSGLQTETSDFGLDFLFLFLNGALGGFFKPGRSLPLEIREEIADIYNSGYSINEVSRTTLVSRRSVSKVVDHYQQYGGGLIWACIVTV